MKRELIVSKNNPIITRLSKLENKKYRELEGLYMLEGEKLFYEAVRFGSDIEYVLLSESFCSDKKEFADSVFRVLSENNCPDTRVLELANPVFEKISTEKSPQGIITVAKTIDFFEKYNTIYNNEEFFSEPRCSVMLCDIRDPGNMGTVLRSACAFELDSIIVDSGCCDLFSPKVVRGSMGAILKAPIKTTTDALSEIETMRNLGVKVYAAALDRDAVSLDKLDTSEGTSVCFVIGNEGHGLDESVISACDGSVFIPMAENTESLNASTASSILMWELFKRKRK